MGTGVACHNHQIIFTILNVEQLYMPVFNLAEHNFEKLFSQNCTEVIIFIFGQALDLLVLVSWTYYYAYTSNLSTWCSSRGLTSLRYGKSHLKVGFTLRCFQRLSLPNIATQPMPLAWQLVHQRSVHPGPLVLRTAPLKFPTPATDRDRTVSRRSEPSSRAALMGEQPNPWDLLQPQDATSRHRGAKPPRRCGLLGEISLLSPR